MFNQEEYISTKKAADFLGISLRTIQRWDKKSHLKSYKHPFNGYKYYKIEELKSIYTTYDRSNDLIQELPKVATDTAIE